MGVPASRPHNIPVVECRVDDRAKWRGVTNGCDTTNRLARVFSHEVGVGSMNRCRTNVRCNSIGVNLVTARGEDQQGLTVGVEHKRVAHLANLDVELLSGSRGSGR